MADKNKKNKTDRVKKKKDNSLNFFNNFLLLGERSFKWSISKIRSEKFKLFIVILALIFVSLSVLGSLSFALSAKNLEEVTVAQIQSSSAILAGEFNNYKTLAEAELHGVYDEQKKCSNMNSYRIRIIDTEYRIVSDSYSVEYGRSIINSRVISAMNNKKSLTFFNSKTNIVELVTPLYNVSNELLGVMLVNYDYSKNSSYMKQLGLRVEVLVIGIMFVMIIITFIYVKLCGSAFGRAYRVVADIAAGHREKRMEVKGSTELRKLATHFNSIMDKSNALEQSRQEFVFNVSHELKTPITSMKVLADSLNMQEDVPIELYKEFMQDIGNEIDRENKIIDDLLSLVKMEKDTLLMSVSSVNINELMEIVLKRLKPIAQKKNIEVLFESFRPVVAEVDDVKFMQIISNLVENAIKYNEINGWVHVSLNADYQYFYVRVEDSGIGIPEEHKEMVFERFYRVDKARSRQTGGTGLGLAIVQKIVVMHHGTIKLHSEEGQGTTFTVRIPLKFVG